MGRTIHRLTFVTDAPGFGGAERYIVAMAKAAQRRGIEPHIYWTPIPNSDLAAFDSAHEAGIEVTCVPIEHTRGWSGVVREFQAMLRGQQPQGLIINACGRPRFWSLPWQARMAGLPAVWVQQMIDGRDYRRLPPSRLNGTMEGLHWWRVPQTVRHRLAGTAASAIVVLNAEDGDRVVRQQGIDHAKVRVIPHGVDLERFTFQAQGRNRLRREWNVRNSEGQPSFLLGTAVRLVTGKGVEPLIEAVAPASSPRYRHPAHRGRRRRGSSEHGSTGRETGRQRPGHVRRICGRHARLSQRPWTCSPCAASPNRSGYRWRKPWPASVR